MKEFYRFCHFNPKSMESEQKAWQTAAARASAVSSGRGSFFKFRSFVTIYIICFFSARPFPVTACFI